MYPYVACTCKNGYRGTCSNGYRELTVLEYSQIFTYGAIRDEMDGKHSSKA